VMDGSKFHQAVRNHPKYANIPFIFISAYDDPETLAVMRFSINDGFMLKQSLFSDIKERIRYFLIPLAERPPKYCSVANQVKSSYRARSYDRKERLGERTSPVFIT